MRVAFPRPVPQLAVDQLDVHELGQLGQLGVFGLQYNGSCAWSALPTKRYRGKKAS